MLADDRRRIVHFNVTAHPTAEWTGQQLREAFPFDQLPRKKEPYAALELKFALRVLKEQGCLIPVNDRAAQSLRLPGTGKTRVYVIDAGISEDKE